MIPKPKRKKKSVNIVKQLDALAKSIALRRDVDRCTLCGKTDRLQASHFFGKGRYPRLRWNLINVHIQCAGCHSLHHHGGQEYTAWWLTEYGRNQFDQLLHIGNQVMSSAERKAFRIAELERLTKLKE